jgi:hypothetical protein
MQLIILLLLAILVSIANAEIITDFEEDCDQSDIIDPDFWNNADHDQVVKLSGCPGSYFQIDITKINDFKDDDDVINYVLVITENENILVHITDEDITQDIFIASEASEELSISVIASIATLPISVPFLIEYQEKQNVAKTYNPGIDWNATKNDDLDSNTISKYFLEGYDSVQLVDLSWNLQDGLGFLALDNGNGRINLFTSPSKNNLKVRPKIRKKCREFFWLH